MIENEKKNLSTPKGRKKSRSKTPRRMKVEEHEVAVGDEVEEGDIHEVEDNDDEEDGARSPYEPSIADEI